MYYSCLKTGVILFVTLLFLLVVYSTLAAEPKPAKLDEVARVAADYDCRFTDGPIVIDGQAKEPAWKLGVPVAEFAIPWLHEGSTKPPTATRETVMGSRIPLFLC